MKICILSRCGATIVTTKHDGRINITRLRLASIHEAGATAFIHVIILLVILLLHHTVHIILLVILHAPHSEELALACNAHPIL